MPMLRNALVLLLAALPVCALAAVGPGPTEVEPFVIPPSAAIREAVDPIGADRGSYRVAQTGAFRFLSRIPTPRARVPKPAPPPRITPGARLFLNLPPPKPADLGAAGTLGARIAALLPKSLQRLPRPSFARLARNASDGAAGAGPRGLPSPGAGPRATDAALADLPDVAAAPSRRRVDPRRLAKELGLFGGLAAVGLAPGYIVQAAYDDNLVAATGGFVAGTDRPDRFIGSAGDDTFYGGLGDDSYEGGSGVNLVEYDGAASDYRILRQPNGSVTVFHPTFGIDTLIGIDALWLRGESRRHDLRALAPPPGGG
ncbi:hypothetical protein [Aquibium microcysteis]|uniref:hypothetical protein n=1 Tax=Aquibium microcysteis TaxID=675281 RepID=UPI00165D07E0|nr:hypothetical protein [Aquibium microcysteis]